MPKFRKKPAVIEAEQFQIHGAPVPAGVCYGQRGLCETPTNPKLFAVAHVHTTHNGQAVVLEAGDWVIPEPDGEHFYPCKPDIFTATYEPVED